MTRAYDWVFLVLGAFATAVGMWLGDPTLLCVGAALFGMPALLARESVNDLAAHPPVYPDHPSVAPLTAQYLAGRIDVDEYTESVEALPWTPTDSSRRAATPGAWKSARLGSTAGAATPTDGSSLRAAFTAPYTGSLAPGEWLSVGQAPDSNPFPYGTTPDGLITTVRVEHERNYREAGWCMPSLTERYRDAEAEARRRWPEVFAGKPVDNPASRP